MKRFYASDRSFLMQFKNHFDAHSEVVEGENPVRNRADAVHAVGGHGDVRAIDHIGDVDRIAVQCKDTGAVIVENDGILAFVVDLVHRGGFSEHIHGGAGIDAA